MIIRGKQNPLSVASREAVTDRGFTGRSSSLFSCLDITHAAEVGASDDLCTTGLGYVPQQAQYSQSIQISQSSDVDRTIERFSLQAAVRDILPSSRTAWCLRRLQKGETDVHVLQSSEHGATFYGKLATCSNLWGCPVCAAKISERRRVELLALIEAHRQAGGQVAFVTLTFSHSDADCLHDTLLRLSKAMTVFKSDRCAKTLRKAYSLVGTVRALEVTHGEANGWHVHVHELWFLAGVNHDLDMLAESLYPQWASACRRAGLGEPSRQRGVTVQSGEYAARYAGKWGLENELTKAHLKKGRVGRFTPWDFLRLYRDGDAGDQARASELFREYAAAFKGQRQLVFSRGLKKMYAIEESTDEELSARLEDNARLLGTLDINQWRQILRANGRGELLKRARIGGWPAVESYLAELEPLSPSEFIQGAKEYISVLVSKINN